MKKLMMMVLAIAVNCFMGATLAVAAGVSPAIGALGLNAVGIVAPSVPGLRAGLYTEVWTGEMVKKLRSSAESVAWLAKVPSYDQYAQNDIIHMVDIGADPEVLINNSTYPLDIQNLDDADIAISLDKYQTKPTRVTDDELYAISYDKMGSVIERHRYSIDEKKISKALHSFAPDEDTASTFVIKTTGETVDGRKRLTPKDLITLKNKFDKAKVPLDGRILVLTPDHASDLLVEDKTFATQYNNRTTGKISNQYGFEIYEYVDSPYYTVSTLKKKAYGSVPGATESAASVAFYAQRMMKATGSTKTYLSEAAQNPTTQENLVGFRHYFIALPKKKECQGAIVSDIA